MGRNRILARVVTYTLFFVGMGHSFAAVAEPELNLDCKYLLGGEAINALEASQQDSRYICQGCAQDARLAAIAQGRISKHNLLARLSEYSKIKRSQETEEWIESLRNKMRAPYVARMRELNTTNRNNFELQDLFLFYEFGNTGNFKYSWQYKGKSDGYTVETTYDEALVNVFFDTGVSNDPNIRSDRELIKNHQPLVSLSDVRLLYTIQNHAHERKIYLNRSESADWQNIKDGPRFRELPELMQLRAVEKYYGEILRNAHTEAVKLIDRQADLGEFMIMLRYLEAARLRDPIGGKIGGYVTELDQAVAKLSAHVIAYMIGRIPGEPISITDALLILQGKRVDFEQLLARSSGETALRLIDTNARLSKAMGIGLRTINGGTYPIVERAASEIGPKSTTADSRRAVRLLVQFRPTAYGISGASTTENGTLARWIVDLVLRTNNPALLDDPEVRGIIERHSIETTVKSMLK